MEFKFEDKDLEKLYTNGKGPYSKIIIKAFFKRMEVIKQAKDENDLRNLKSNHFEKLKSRKKDYSIRLNKQYRLEFEWLKYNASKRLLIKKISNHYE